MTHTTYEMIYIKTLFEDVGFNIAQLNRDNQPIIYVTNNSIFDECTKQIEVDWGLKGLICHALPLKNKSLKFVQSFFLLSFSFPWSIFILRIEGSVSEDKLC